MARAIGVLPAILLLVAGWPVGSWVIRSQGRAAWTRLEAAAAAGGAPARTAVDGALILLGGIMLIVPGFVTDALGILLLVRPVRGLIRRAAARRLKSSLILRAARLARRRAPPRGPAPRYDVDSTASDVDVPRLGR